LSAKILQLFKEDSYHVGQETHNNNNKGRKDAAPLLDHELKAGGDDPSNVGASHE
jgi:hypothetical protein